MSLELNPLVAIFTYMHAPGNKDRKLVLPALSNQTITLDEQIILDYQNDLIKNTEQLYPYLQNIIKNDPKLYLKEQVDMFFEYLSVPKDAYIFDTIELLNTSNSFDVVQYLKVVNNDQSVKTLFEMLNTSNPNVKVMFTNPSKTKQFKFKYGTYPTKTTSGGTYSIGLFEKPYGKSDKNLKLLKKFTNNNDVYSYIANYNLIFDNKGIKNNN